jgi:hypothetical protein
MANIAPWKTGRAGLTGYNSIRARFEVLMSHDSRFPDPRHTWHKVFERLYHEDHILYARMNNFSTVQAFLATALAFTTSATTICQKHQPCGVVRSTDSTCESSHRARRSSRGPETVARHLWNVSLRSALRQCSRLPVARFPANAASPTFHLNFK